MLAIDTNIVIRLLTDDDPGQAEAARQAMDGQDIFLSVTVQLETEWVLRAGYDFTPVRIADALRALAGLPNMTVEDAEGLAIALDWMADGLDFADAHHLARSSHCEEFLTFDRKLVKRAGALGTMAIRVP